MRFVRYFFVAACFCLLLVLIIATTNGPVAQSKSADSPLPRSHHVTLAFDNKMWVIGGTDRDNAKDDVWYSVDGIYWTCTNASVGFPEVGDKRALVYNNRMWVIAQPSDWNKKNEVWSSADGKIWTRVTDAPDFSPRDGSSVLAFDSRMWVIGGNSHLGKNDVWENDVWYSTNGINWSCANASAAFPGRAGQASFVSDNKMWVVGGVTGVCLQYSNDIWYSADGIIWTQATTGAAFSKNDFFTSLVYDNRIWVFVGDQVWQSADGVSWTLAKTLPEWTHYYSSQNKLVYKKRMWVISGDDHGLGDDVWYSRDGAIWTRADTARRIWPRTGHTATVFNDRIWLVGGESRDRDKALNDTWYSADGSHWLKGATPPFSPRIGHSSVVFENKLWVIGGAASGNKRNNEVWYTADGTTWESANMSAAFFPGGSHSSVVFDKKMWVIGGRGGDVWYSSDGTSWNCANMSLSPLTGASQAAVVFGNRLWIVGGVFVDDNGYEYLRYESWYTTDGAIWTRANGSLPFTVNSPHSLVSYAGRIWMIDGYNGVWNSPDGYVWNRVADYPAALSYRTPVILIYNNTLWAIGGDQMEYRDDAWHSADGINWIRNGDSSAQIPPDELEREQGYGGSFSVICNPYCFPGVEPLWLTKPVGLDTVSSPAEPTSPEERAPAAGCEL